MPLYFTFLAALAVCFVSAETISQDDGRNKTVTVPLRLLGGETHTTAQKFWYGSFDVGQAKNLSLIIDTDSGTLILNPDRYKASKTSQELNFTSTVGFGCGFKSEKISVHADTVSIGGLSIQHQAFGTFLSPYIYPSVWGHDGIAGIGVGNFLNGWPGWFSNLCNQGQLEECRFGTAFGIDGTGKLVFGEVDETLFDGELTPVPFPRGETSSTKANIVVDGKELLIGNRTMGSFDTGTENIGVPLEDARKIFEHFGIPYVEKEVQDTACETKTYIHGFYPCDKAPMIGIQFLSETATSTADVQGPVFNIEPEAFRWYSLGNNNCTAVIQGNQGTDYWFVGHPWMQGKYIDHGRWGLAQGGT